MSNAKQTATITPLADARECSADDCTTGELLARVEPDAVDERRILCPTHRVEWLREVSER